MYTVETNCSAVRTETDWQEISDDSRFRIQWQAIDAAHYYWKHHTAPVRVVELGESKVWYELDSAGRRIR